MNFHIILKTLVCGAFAVSFLSSASAQGTPTKLDSIGQQTPIVSKSEQKKSKAAKTDMTMKGMDMKGMKMGGDSANKAVENGYYTCPMHPEIHKDQPGNCPICGMTLMYKKVDKDTTTMKNMDQKTMKKEKN
ncbi:MAG: hypothetical protein JW795_17715 [Chitinivibrionales bacterium]|nr:hypothetical protein [Chitinivibrionales bacterium]